MVGRNCNIDFEIYSEDLPLDRLRQIKKCKYVAWDIETTGLEWKKESIATCQLCIPEKRVFIVRMTRNQPERLGSLLSDNSLKKIFHHAMFDLRFMAHHWKVEPRNIACTKIAAKLLYRKRRNLHSLKGLIKHYFQVDISKKEQMSNWLSDDLTNEQIQYATNDVIYLNRLLEKLEEELKAKQLLDLARNCFAHVPTRVKLDLLGYEDVYTY